MSANRFYYNVGATRRLNKAMLDSVPEPLLDEEKIQQALVNIL